MEGHEFRALSDEEVEAQLGRIRVLARALPDDKKRMVELLQRNGEVVAVTGDGVNDAPALVTADVGFAMGSGSKVAREASDIVIVDDNFVSLVRAIRWGRSVFENIRKFLQFQLTVNVAALATAFVAAVLGKGTPLTAVQLLWVNLIMDSLAALALALEPPTRRAVRPAAARARRAAHLPVDVDARAGDGCVHVRGAAARAQHRLFIDASIADPDETLYRYTLLFNVFVWFQIWNEFNCRSVRFNRNPFRGLLESRTFLGIVAVIVVLQVLLIEFGGQVFSTVPLSWRDWFVSVGLGATALVVGAVIRIVGRLVVSDPHA